MNFFKSKRARRAIPAIAVCGALAASALATDSSASQAPEARAAEEVVLTVNGSPITNADFDRALTAALSVPVEMLPDEQREAIHEQMRPKLEEKLVADRLLEAAATAIAVDEAEVDQAIAEIKGRLPEGADFDEQLKKAGLTSAALRAEITRGLAVDALLRERTKAVSAPTEDQVETFYRENSQYFERPESVEARHILVPVEEGASDEDRSAARAKAEEIRSSVTTENFGELAAKHSSCPSKENGGSLGRFERGQMVPAFEEAAFGRKVGEIGELVESPFGFHIVEVVARHEKGTVSLDEARPSIVRHLEGQARRAAIETYIAGLREKASIIRPKTGA